MPTTETPSSPPAGASSPLEEGIPHSVADSRRSLTLSLLGVTTVAVLVGISAYAQRSDLQSTGLLLSKSKPGWLVLMLGFALLSLASVCAMHTSAQRVVGLSPTYVSLLRPTLRGHMLNLVTKSNGLAGLVAFSRHGRQINAPQGAVLGAYLLTTVIQQLGFSLVVSIVFAVLILSGQFTTGYLLAGLAFVVYVAFNLTLFVAATRSQDTIRSIYRKIARLNPWRSQKVGEPDYRNADEFFQAVQLIRTDPLGAAKVLAPTMVFELALAGILAAALKAVGASAPIVIALIAFAISSLIGIISFLPAGLGFVEVSSVAVLVASGVPPQRAAAATALYRLSQLWLPIMMGVAASGGRVRPVWWRPLRTSAASLAVLTGVVAMVSAAATGSMEAITATSRAGGVIRSDTFVTALLASVMFSLAAALWRGKRWAAILAPVVGVGSFITAPSESGDIALALVPMTFVVLLGAEAFGVRSDADRLRAGLRRFAAGELAVAGYGIGGLYLLDEHFRTSASLIASIYEGLRLVLLLPPDTVEAQTVHGAIFVESVRLMSMAMAATLVFSVLFALVAGRVRAKQGAPSK